MILGFKEFEKQETNSKGKQETVSVLIKSWFVSDGYGLDILFAAVVLIINQYVALGVLEPINR